MESAMRHFAMTSKCWSTVRYFKSKSRDPAPTKASASACPKSPRSLSSCSEARKATRQGLYLVRAIFFKNHL